MRKKRLFIFAIAGLLLFSLGLGAGWLIFVKQNKPSINLGNGGVPRLDHVVIIMEENKSYGEIMGSPQAPFINQLARQYAYASNYYGTDRPSEPNYLEIVSGLKSKIQSDCTPLEQHCSSSDKSVADDLETVGKTWKAYAESMPKPCSLVETDKYKDKHNPFIYFEDIRRSPERCKKHDVPYTELAKDFKNIKTTPNYAFITPNICNDMHDCPVSTGDKWLKQEVPKILNSPAFTKQNSLLIITWDEDDDTNLGGNAGNHIPTIYAGQVVKSGYITQGYQDHYTTYRTIDNALGLHPSPYGRNQVVNDIFKQAVLASIQHLFID